MIAFGYYGGKNAHLADILPLLPETECYVEPFFGSGSVLLNKRPALIEVANDLNSDLVHFFRTLRSNRGWELIEKISLTPYSREDFTEACGDLSAVEDPVERARLWYVRICQSRNSLPMARPRNWSFATQFPRREMAGPVSKWLNKPSELSDVINRIMTVQIECDDAQEVIKRYDSANCLFYVDPPYVSDTRKHAKVYRFEMSNDDHRALAATLNAVQGKVALSGYEGELYDELYASWHKTVFEEKMVGSSNKQRAAQEVLWTNYDTKNVTGVQQMEMF